MQIARIVLEFLEVLAWPSVTIILFLVFRKTIDSLVPRSKIKFTISGVTIETNPETLEESVTESLRGTPLTEDQWEWLRRLNAETRLRYDHNYYDQLRPLRNSGLIKEHPEGWLTTAEEIEITTLGKLLFQASKQRQ